MCSVGDGDGEGELKEIPLDKSLEHKSSTGRKHCIAAVFLSNSIYPSPVSPLAL